MCTVTVIPYGDTLFITSNRDEHVLRASAALPNTEIFSSGKILFPKDGLAGGTWLATHENGNIMVLLNGGVKKHISEPPYRKSRGLIFLEIFNSTYPVKQFDIVDLNHIEPFTLIVFQYRELWKLVWDGEVRQSQILDKSIPHIWSSVTLYDAAVRKKREEWFHQWLQEKDVKNGAAIREFHEFGGEGDANIDLRMNRNGMLMTVSITGIEVSTGKLKMVYKDLEAGLVSVHEWLLPAREGVVL